jgi:antibiotic biosynthesis monooxygenase (ABM) superfamily enzyme
MVLRMWHGWTIPSNADAYEALLKEEIFVGIGDRKIPGYRGIRLLRRAMGSEVEFVTIMTFDDIEAVRQFAGQDYEAAVVPPKARALLARFDQRSQHYELRAELSSGS